MNKIKNIVTSYTEILDNMKYLPYNKLEDVDVLFDNCKSIFFAIRCSLSNKFVLSGFLEKTTDDSYSYLNNLLENLHKELDIYQTNSFFMVFEIFKNGTYSGDRTVVKTINLNKSELVDAFISIGTKNLQKIYY